MISWESSALVFPTARLELKSGSNDACVTIQAEKAWKPGANPNDKYVEDPSRTRQIIRASFFSGEVEIVGDIPEPEAVRPGQAWKVVVEVDLTETTLGAYQAGGKSKAIPTMKLVRVLEIWRDASKAVYRARDGLLGASGKTVDMGSDRIAKP